MLLKKILFVLFFLSAAIAHTSEDKNPPAPTEQVAPPEQQPQTPPPAMQQGPAPLPSSEEVTSSYEGAFIRMIVTLLGLVFLVFATFWILKRLGKGQFKMGSGRLINIVEKRALSPKSVLYIVEIGNKKVLIAESQLEVRALSTYEEVPEEG